MAIFNFMKKSILKTFSKDKILVLFDMMKVKIIEQAKYEIIGSDKKNNVDLAIVDFIRTNMKTSNPIVNTLINILIEYVPLLTQCIYEYLKKYVDGLTEV